MFKQIRAKLLIWFLLVAVLPIATGAWLEAGSVSRSVEHGAFTTLRLLAEERASLVAAWRQRVEGSLDFLAHSEEVLSLSELAQAELNAVVATSSDILALELWSEAGELICAAGSFPEGFSAAPVPGTTSRPKWGNPFAGNDGGRTVVERSLFDKEGVYLGTIRSLVTLTGIVAQVSTTIAGESIECLLLAADGLFISSTLRDQELVASGRAQSGAAFELRNETDGYQYAASGLKGEEKYTNYFGRPVFGAFRPIGDSGWVILAEADVEATMATARAIRTYTFAAAGLVFVAIAVAALLLSNNLARPLVRLATEAQRVAEGDLSSDLEPSRRQDEIGRLSNAFRSMVASMRGVVGQMAEAAEELSLGSRELSTGASEATEATHQISATIQQVAAGTISQTQQANELVRALSQLRQAIDGIANGAAQQAEAVDKASRETAQMVNAVERVASNAEEVAQSATQTRESAERGAVAVHDTVEGMDRIRHAVLEAAKEIRSLGTYSEQIGQIIQVISEIAEQTNLLALNAAIEAARAGEHGRGFAVVADAVRQLAERSAVSTKEIAKLVATIQAGIDRAVKGMDTGTHEVEGGSRLAAHAGKALDEIKQLVNGTTDQIQEISAATQQIVANTRVLVRAIDDVATIAEENSAATQQMAAYSIQVAGSADNIAAITEEAAASAEEVSASSEEVTASVQHFAQAAQALFQLAGRLQQLVSGFKL
ncbi:MAG: methyl-accepting chemotaxis protein [Bacillota bacterium]